jgi:hypothetical protein
MPGPVPYLIFAVGDNFAAVTEDACVSHDLFFSGFDATARMFTIRQTLLSGHRSIFLLLWSQRSAHSAEQPANPQRNSGSRVGLGFDRIAEPGIAALGGHQNLRD